MEQEVRWPVEWTDRLQRLIATLSGVVDPDATAREAVEQGRAALGASAGVVFLLNPEGDALEMAHGSGYPTEILAFWKRIPLSSNVPITEAVRSRQTVIVASRDDGARRYPAMAHPSPSAIPQNSWAVVPLVVDEACIGALGFTFAEAEAVDSPQQLAFLRVVADQCAQALRRAQLTERERRSTARLRVLAQASRMFAAADPEVGSVLDALAAAVLAHVGQTSAIALASPDGEWLERPTIHDRDPAREETLRQLTATLRVRRGEGFSGQALAMGRAVLVPSVVPLEMQARAAASISRDVEALRVRSVLVVPLKTSGRTLGTITTSRYDEDNPFTEDDCTLLEDLADRAALAIENARLHEAERQARARAEESDRRKDEFLAMLGHELRNPLAPIWTAIEIMRELPAPGERYVWAREALGRQVAQLARLVDDLLDISRINLGKIELRLEAVDLGAVALQALEASLPLLTERNQKLSVDLPSVPVRVRGDVIRLMQVISNLLNNASKYTDGGGHVRLSVGARGGQAFVTVADTGIGIPADMLERVFEAFAQGQGAQERSKGGLGVGLTLVKRLVEMHGGYVRASSPGEGRGSEFVLGLPELDASDSPKSDASRPAEGPSSSSRRVLIADDNVDAAEGLRLLLKKKGHEVHVVHDGVAAAEAMARLLPDLALLDIGLPGLDGLEVARRTRARGGPWRPLLVAVTGLGRDEDRERSAEAGFDQHLVKPIDLRSLDTLLGAAPGGGGTVGKA